ncbi:MAG: GNAT family N-acetyltransferase [Bacteroidetes bacterium]|nr:GNAT family N-acetyltransferase [Bacteroidota bacterium]
MEFCLQEGQTISSKAFELNEKKYQLLDLNVKHEILFKEYSDNAKRNIKKAIKAGLKIRPDIAPEKIVQLFKTTKGNELEVFSPQDYRTLIQLMDMCNDLKKGQSIAIYDGDKLCAAAFFMFSNNRFTFLKSGVTDDGKAKGAMHLLFDYFIKENSGKKYQLDFGGSSVENVARFYKNFGAKDCVYLQVKRNNLPALVKWVKSLKK